MDVSETDSGLERSLAANNVAKSFEMCRERFEKSQYEQTPFH